VYLLNETPETRRRVFGKRTVVNEIAAGRFFGERMIKCIMPPTNEGQKVIVIEI
jgi:hypothetical protein